MQGQTQASKISESVSSARRLIQLARYQNIQLIGLLLVWGILIFVISRLAPFFLTLTNVLTIGRYSVTSFVAAAGMTLALISGGLDLSLGSTMMIAGVITGTMFMNGIPLQIALVMGLASGPIVGCINGLLITRTRINPLIATLGVMYLVRGAGYLIAGGKTKTISDVPFQWARFSLGGIPVPIFFLIAVFVVVYYMLNHTTLGKHIYAIGGNPDAARQAAMNVERYRMIVYIMAGSLSALAGVILCSIIGAVDPSAAQDRALEIATAVLLGGASLDGGRGSIIGSLIGVLFISSLYNGLVGIGVVPEWVSFINGALLIGAVAIDQLPRGGWR
jgi:ribose transport system permease protein